MAARATRRARRLARALDATVALGVRDQQGIPRGGAARARSSARRGDDGLSSHAATVPVSTLQKPTSRCAIAAALLAAKCRLRRAELMEHQSARVMRRNSAMCDVALTLFAAAPITRDTRVAVRHRPRLSTSPHARVSPLDGAADETVAFVIEGETIHLARRRPELQPDGEHHARARCPHGGASDGRLVAPMSGRVVAVNVRAGDTAEAGRAHDRARSHEDGARAERAVRRCASKAVHVDGGAQVTPGQLLVELEPQMIRAHPALTAEHEALRETMRRFVAQEIAPHANAWDESEEFPRDLYYKAADVGLLGIGFPEEYGGTPADLFTHVDPRRGDRARRRRRRACLAVLAPDRHAADRLTRAARQLKARVLPPVIGGREDRRARHHGAGRRL